MAGIRLLCWNRAVKDPSGYHPDPNEVVTRQAWDNYWRLINEDGWQPDIIFLQNEFAAHSLFRDINGYTQYFNGSDGPSEAAIAVRYHEDITRANRDNFDFSAFVSYVLHNRNDADRKRVMDAMRKMFSIFPDYVSYIQHGSATFGCPPDNIIITTEDIEELSCRICIVPLNIRQNKVIAVSVYTRTSKQKGRKEAVDLFQLLDRLGQMTVGCTAVVVGGEFNCHISGADLRLNEVELNEVDLNEAELNEAELNAGQQYRRTVERLEREGLERERLERERLERERLERERLERERLERKRLERERLRERLIREGLHRERPRLERERLNDDELCTFTVPQKRINILSTDYFAYKNYPGCDTLTQIQNCRADSRIWRTFTTSRINQETYTCILTLADNHEILLAEILTTPRPAN